MLDLIIKNGLIIDGSGSPGFYGAVLVENEAVTIHRGDMSHLEAARVIDATDHVVCPGFVDLHSHAGLTILGAPHHDQKIRHIATMKKEIFSNRITAANGGPFLETKLI